MEPLVIDKFMPRNENNTITVGTPWFDLNAKASNIIEDMATHNAAQLGKIESHINGITDMASTAAISAAASAAIASAVDAKLSAFTNYQGEWTAKSYAAKQGVSVNGDFYMATASLTATEIPGVSPKWTLTATKPKPNKVANMSKNGHNVFGCTIDGVPYTTSGVPYTTSGIPTTAAEATNTVYWAYTGRGNTGETVHFGVDNLKKISLPTGSVVEKMETLGAITLIKTTDKSLYVFGRNSGGQGGLGHNNFVPTPIISATNVEEIYVHSTNNESGYFSANIVIKKSDGFLYGCGVNSSGALGIGNASAKNVWTALAAPNRGVWDQKGVYAQGDGVSENGLLYVANTTPAVGASPALTPAWTKVTAFDLIGQNPKRVFNMGGSMGSIFVLTGDGRIVASGINTNGQLGTGDATNRLRFTDVTKNWAGVDSGVKDIKVVGGTYVTAAASATLRAAYVMLITLVDDTKIVKAAGDNTYGQLGDGSNTARYIPVTPIKSDNVVDIAGLGGGSLSVFMLKGDNSVWSFGYNINGELGDGTATNRSIAIQVDSNVKALLCDGVTTHFESTKKQAFIQKLDGYLYSAGYNAEGELGVGDYIYKSTFTKCLIPEPIIDLGRFATGDAKFVMVAIGVSGTMYAWGANVHGGISGTATAANIHTPTTVDLPNTGAK